ncbi:MAG: DUF2199 domain-containing protein [Rhodobacteraceae bacterium]|nr:DUF2199 domain-containing protein [Paracoccaceae bacterium]
MAPVSPDWSALSWLFDPAERCACCDQPGETLLSLAYSGPDVFPGPHQNQPNAALPAARTDILTEDFCVMDKYRFVRAMIELPLQGRPELMLIGVWGTLSQTNFARYVDLSDARQTHLLPAMNSWLSNAVPPGTPLPVACQMQARDDSGLRPLLLVQDQGPLMAWQQDGLTPADLALLLRAYGHTDARLG